MKNYLILCRRKTGEVKTVYLRFRATSIKLAKQQFNDMYGSNNFKIIAIYKEVEKW